MKKFHENCGNLWHNNQNDTNHDGSNRDGLPALNIDDLNLERL
ncbi:hypothetical protein [Moraxella nasibovis]|nr:hypothetical protein [Moraxella nasibovis]